MPGFSNEFPWTSIWPLVKPHADCCVDNAQRTLAASCVCWIVPIVALESGERTCGCSCLKCTSSQLKVVLQKRAMCGVESCAGRVNPRGLRVPAFAGLVREPALLCVRARVERTFCGEGAGCTKCGCGTNAGWEILYAGNWVLSQSAWT